MKSQPALKLIKFLHGQHGLAIGELWIFCNISVSPGILAWFCLTAANGNWTHDIHNIMFHFFWFSPRVFSRSDGFLATVIMLIMLSIMAAQFAHYWRTVPRPQSRIYDVSLRDLLRPWVRSWGILLLLFLVQPFSCLSARFSC